MMRWVVSLGVLVGLLVGAWSEGVRLHAWLLREAADRAYYEGDLDSVLVKYERVRELLPDYPGSHTDLADSISQALAGTPGRTMEPEVFEELASRAARCYLDAIRNGPPSAWSYAGLGSLARSLRRLRVSREDTDLSGLSLDPLDNLRPEDRLYEATMVKAVQLEPRNYYYRDFLGDFYLRRGLQDRALEHFRIAVRLHPALQRHYYLSDLVTVSPAVLSAVESGIQEALQSPDTEVPAFVIHRFLAAVYLRMGRLQEARTSLEAAAEVAPDPYVVDIRIGNLLAKEGDDEGALEMYRRAAEREPDIHGAWLQMGLTLSRLERHDEAVEAARRARSLNPTDFMSSWTLARVLDSAGLLDEATDVLEKLIRSHGERQYLYLRLISIYERQGKLSYAARVARQLAARFPEEPVFKEQLEQLEQAVGETP